MIDRSTPDMFAGAVGASPRAPQREMPAELRIARSLCRQIKRTPVREEKQRIAHELCGTLIQLCRRGAMMGTRSHKWDIPVLTALAVRPRTARELAQELGTTLAVIHLTMSNLKQAGRTLATDYIVVDYSDRSVMLYGIVGVHPPFARGKSSAGRIRSQPRRKPRAASGSGQRAGHVYYRQLANWG